MSVNYSKAPFFDDGLKWLMAVYTDQTPSGRSTLNLKWLVAICNYLAIPTTITSSSDYLLPDGTTERLVGLCEQAGASEYISGPSAKNYIEPELFSDVNIKLSWFDYEGYSEYPQLWGPFEHGVTILDLLMNCGRSAKRSMRFVK